MRYPLQILRDIAEEHSRKAAEANDRDSADAWENIAEVIDGANRGIGRVWRVVQERNPGIELQLIREVAANMHAAARKDLWK